MIEEFKMKNLAHLKENLLVQISSSGKTEILNKFSLNQYVTMLDSLPEIGGYQKSSREIKQFCEEIVAASDVDTLDRYHRLLLLALIQRAEGELHQMTFTTQIKRLFRDNFARIAKAFEDNTYPECLFSNDRFCKDLALCCLRLIPLGPLKMHANAIGRRILLRNGIRKFVEGLWFFLVNTGGFKPFYEMHIDSKDPKSIKDYNLQGRIRAYLQVAEMLIINPHIKGIYASNWYFDPKLKKISPQLNHVRDLLLENGGKLFYVGRSDQATRDAILKSGTRRRLYEEGKYIPTVYMIVWSRRAILSWASKHGLRT